MSKSSLSYLKGEIKTSMSVANSTVSELKSLEGAITKAMNDRVGQGARDSLASISRTVSYNVDKGYKALNNGAEAMTTGYNKIESISNQGASIVSRAREIVKGLGSI